jgi:hypothetical protein
LDESLHGTIIIFIFRKEEKRAKIEERHRLQQIYNNTHERQQLTKRDVSFD